MTTQPEQRDARDVVERVREEITTADRDGRGHPSISITVADLRALLALATQPPQRDGAEPLAWQWRFQKHEFRDGPGEWHNGGDRRAIPEMLASGGYDVRNLYTAPPPDERNAEIARLTKRVEILASALQGSAYDTKDAVTEITTLTAERDQARAQCDAFKADAERLAAFADNGDKPAHIAINKWLVQVVDRDGVWHTAYFAAPPSGTPEVIHSTRILAVRAAIDAMRAREGENGNG